MEAMKWILESQMHEYINERSLLHDTVCKMLYYVFNLHESKKKKKKDLLSPCNMNQEEIFSMRRNFFNVIWHSCGPSRSSSATGKQHGKTRKCMFLWLQKSPLITLPLAFPAKQSFTVPAVCPDTAQRRGATHRSLRPTTASNTASGPGWLIQAELS